MRVVSLIILLSLFFAPHVMSQTNYVDSMNVYRKNYVDEHEVVKGDDRKKLSFFPVNKKYLVEAKVERVKDGKWFSMETSGITKQVYRVYAILHFKLDDAAVKLSLYQSQRLMGMQEYAKHLFLPFADLTSGDLSYETGRYIDLSINDIRGDKVTVDFNKAYNPYCAYVDGVYNCPIPPPENRLSVSIKAGELKYKN